MKSFKRQIYKFGQFEDNEKNPPTVDDNSVSYTDGIFTFTTSSFTNNFQDKDNDSYKLTKVVSLPPVGLIKYNGTLIQKDFVFNLDNVGLLTYELPDTYMVTADGYCVFQESISTIIANKALEGYDLTFLGEGRLEFEKSISTSIPNDTDIYAFFDATSMDIADAEAAQAALLEWYDNYKTNNQLFTGELYILPIFKEDWVDFPNIIWRGSSDRVIYNPSATSGFAALTILPPNFDTTSTTTNGSWTPPTKLLTLAFIDEVSDGSEAYHKNRNGYGFEGQPTSQYFTDYKNFKNNYENNFDFFKGIFYPIPDIEYGNYNNIFNACVLQGFAAIEGGATYTLQEIEDLGVTFAEERRFHWHLDPTHPNYTGASPTVANPYSPQANTDVPNTNYQLQGLKDFGWVGVYDKDQPASEVFNSDTFSADLNKYLQGETIETTETDIVYGDCTLSNDICFNFKTTDDSEYLLYSNLATFCFTGTNDVGNVDSELPPTVGSVSKSYDKTPYSFILSDFTTNFTDPDGDSYANVKILTPFKSSKDFTVGEVQYSAVPITYPYEMDLTNIGNLTYNFISNSYIIDGRFYKFNESLSTAIPNLETQGYALLENKGNEFSFYKLDVTDPQNPIEDIQTIKGNDIGDNTICLTFRTSDDSSFNLYSNLSSVCLSMVDENTAPTVLGGSDNITSNEYIFSQSNFNTSFTDSEADTLKSVRIESFIETTTGSFTFKGIEINTPFAFNIGDVADFKFTLDTSYSAEAGGIYVFDNTEAEILALYPNYSITDKSEGVITLTKTDTEVELIYLYGEEVITESKCLSFKVSDSNEYPMFSNSADFCLGIPVDSQPIVFNQRPTVEGKSINIEPRQNYTFTVADFTTNYNDPEGDTYFKVMITQLPSEGTITIDGVDVILGEVIEISGGTLNNVLVYEPNALNSSSYSTSFKFKISDVGSTRFSESAVIDIAVADSYNIPTVDDNSGALTTKSFTFAETSFTNNFADLDGDTYYNVKITDLPQVGRLELLGVVVNEGDVFKAINSSGLKYYLPDNYAVYSGVLYEFDNDLTTVITNYDTQGYKLTDNTSGVLTFTSESDITDIVKYEGIILNNSALCLKFATSDDSTFKAYSLDAEFCLIPQGDINVKPIYVNLPPTIGDNRISTKYNEAKLLTKSTFVEDTHPSYSDPEGDEPWYLKVLTLPSDGVLELDGVTVTIDQEILFTDIIDEKFFYIPDATNTTIPSVEFEFTIKDTGSNQYA